MKDNDKMPFGKHRGTAMANVPDSYLVWFWDNNETAYSGGVMVGVDAIIIMDYIKESGIDLIRKQAKNERQD